MQKFAYGARYGHQPLSELRRLTVRDLDLFLDALYDIVRRENAKDDDGDDDP